MAGSHDGTRLDEAADGIVAGRAADGDQAAFGVLVRRYSTLMRAGAMRVLGTSDEADDVVQDAFIVAWQQLPELDNPAAVNSWLMRIVSRKAIDRIRARRPQADIADEDPPASEAAGPARIVEARSELEALSEALSALPEQQRQCWTLREISGYNYDEIAHELEIPVSTVRGLLARARRFLIVRMEEWR